jgi:hypothetical protein
MDDLDSAVKHCLIGLLMHPITLLFLVVVCGFVIYWIKQDKKATGGFPRALLRAAKGDRQLAKRLVEGVKLRHPGKSEQWYYEKVLYDLERDGAGRGRL